MARTKHRALRFLKRLGKALVDELFSDPEVLLPLLALLLIGGILYELVTALPSLGQTVGSSLDALSINPDKWNFHS